MYSENNPGGIIDGMFGWVIYLFGSSMAMHTMHHLIAWIFPVYLIGHIYAVLRHDIVDRTSVTSSIITGYKHSVEECPEFAE